VRSPVQLCAPAQLPERRLQAPAVVVAQVNLANQTMLVTRAPDFPEDSAQPVSIVSGTRRCWARHRERQEWWWRV